MNILNSSLSQWMCPRTSNKTQTKWAAKCEILIEIVISAFFSFVFSFSLSHFTRFALILFFFLALNSSSGTCKMSYDIQSHSIESQFYKGIRVNGKKIVMFLLKFTKSILCVSCRACLLVCLFACLFAQSLARSMSISFVFFCLCVWLFISKLLRIEFPYASNTKPAHGISNWIYRKSLNMPIKMLIKFTM